MPLPSASALSSARNPVGGSSCLPAASSAAVIVPSPSAHVPVRTSGYVPATVSALASTCSFEPAFTLNVPSNFSAVLSVLLFAPSLSCRSSGPFTPDSIVVLTHFAVTFSIISVRGSVDASGPVIAAIVVLVEPPAQYPSSSLGPLGNPGKIFSVAFFPSRGTMRSPPRDRVVSPYVLLDSESMPSVTPASTSRYATVPAGNGTESSADP